MKSEKSIAYIRAIARTRSISAAADELGITQPAVSAHLKKVESKVGAALFDRARTPLELTEAGRAYLEFAESEAALEQELARKISDITDLRTGRLVIGGASSFNVAYLPRAIAQFAKRYPGIEIAVAEGTVSDLSAMALEGSVDVLITPRPVETENFEYEKLIVERAYLCVPREWPLASELPAPSSGEPARLREEDFEMLAQHPFVMLHERQQVGMMLRALLKRHHVDPSRIIIVEQTLTALALTQAGVGISLITEGALNYASSMAAPALLTSDEDLCTRMLYLAHPKNRSVSRAASEFITIMRDQAAHKS